MGDEEDGSVREVRTGVECVGSCPFEICDEGPLRRCGSCGVWVCESHGGYPRPGRGPRCGPCSSARRNGPPQRPPR